jgi:HK97 family phage portal protein
VWASLAAISEAVMGLPVEETIKQADGRIRRDPPDVFYQPTPDLSWETWIWAQAWTLAASGRCYAYVLTDSIGQPTSLTPIPDGSVEWRFNRSDNLWETYVERVKTERWPRGPLWHVPLYAKPEMPQGMSPIAHHAETIGVGLAAQEFGARWFSEGGHPTLLLRPSKDPGVKGAAALKARVQEILGGGSREPLIVPDGTGIERWQVAPNESQFLDTMRYSGEDVARIFGVKAGKIGLATSGQNITYSNRADENADWRMSGLLRYTRALESGLSRLVGGGQTRLIRFNYNEFLRADLGARVSANKTQVDIGAMSIDEFRAEEGRAPIPGGNTYARAGAPVLKVNDDGTIGTEPGEASTARGSYDPVVVATALQKLYLAVGKVVTADEARMIASSLGVELPPGFTPPAE